MTTIADETRIPVNYQKSRNFRVVLAEGCFGGISPRGVIRSAFYNERSAIPQDGEITIRDGQAVTETVTNAREGLVREVEVEVVMDLTTALSYHVWLSEKLEVLRKSAGISDEDWARMASQVTLTGHK